MDVYIGYDRPLRHWAHAAARVQMITVFQGCKPRPLHDVRGHTSRLRILQYVKGSDTRLTLMISDNQSGKAARGLKVTEGQWKKNV